jgi:hypothetical protein
MSDFFVPDMDAVTDSSICSEGSHDATITDWKAAVSKSSGKPMMVVEFTIDSGEDAGHTLVEYIVFGSQGRFGERKLKEICTICGYKWRTKGTIDAFVAQFPPKEWRLSVDVEWDYQVKTESGWRTVDKEAYEEVSDEDLRAIRPRIRSFNNPKQKKPDLSFEAVEAAADAEEASDDEIPF